MISDSEGLDLGRFKQFELRFPTEIFSFASILKGV